MCSYLVYSFWVSASILANRPPFGLQGIVPECVMGIACEVPIYLYVLFRISIQFLKCISISLFQIFFQKDRDLRSDPF